MEPSLPIKEIVLLPPVERQRPPRAKRFNRERLVSLGITVGSILLVGTLVWAATMFVMTSPVPRVVGVEKGIAVTRLEQAGFRPKIVEVRFSTEPAGSVLEQIPDGGSRAQPESIVQVVVSGGVDQSVMPDFVGETIEYAQLYLRQVGVSAMVLTVRSDEAPGRIVGTKPVAGAALRAGDNATLRVSASKGSGDVVAYDLRGFTVVLDPRVGPEGSMDSSYEIALRARSLLEAAGARVAMTRSAAELGIGESTLDARARDADPDAYALLSFRNSGGGGVVVRGPRSGETSGADTLPALVYDNVRVLGLSGTIGDPDSAVANIADEAVSLSLGDLSSSLDRQHFADASWREAVARALYLAIGERLSP